MLSSFITSRRGGGNALAERDTRRKAAEFKMRIQKLDEKINKTKRLTNAMNNNLAPRRRLPHTPGGGGTTSTNNTPEHLWSYLLKVVRQADDSQMKESRTLHTVFGDVRQQKAAAKLSERSIMKENNRRPK